MKVKVERLNENEYLVVVPRKYKNSAVSINAISKAMNVSTPATWHIRTEGFLKDAATVEV